MRTRILHLADLHLGDAHAYLNERSAERRREADGVLRRIVDWALTSDSRVGGVIIAGDLFEHYDPPSPLVDAVLEDLRRLEASGIQVLIVPGNHDEYSYPASVYRHRDWPGRLVTEPMPVRVARWELNGNRVDLYAMAFVAGRSHRPFDRFAVEDAPGVRKIAVLHGSLDVEWTDRSLPLRRESLAGLDLDYIALGHIHAHGKHRVGGGWACYPGRIEGGSFDDPGGAGLVLVDLAAGELIPERQSYPSRTIAVERWDLSSIHEETTLEARIERTADPEKIMRLVWEGIPGFILDPQRLVSRWKHRFFHLEVRSPEETLLSPDLDAIERERTIRGEFVALGRRKIAAARDESERRRLVAALRYGLSAFAAVGPGDDGGSRPGRRPSSATDPEAQEDHEPSAAVPPGDEEP